MQWEKLLSLQKHGDSKPRKRKDQTEDRLDFEVDFDRIIFSAPFRLMQDKTQVIPLSKTDFVHTRLTHSLEVSVVGRSLGRLAGKSILQKHPHLIDLDYQIHDFGAIVAAACLAHDIGNPPFGHSGEKAIGEFFEFGKGKEFQSQLTPKQWQDLVKFEGNANGFSLLTTSRPGMEGGLRLTYATLGAFLKYPKESLPHKPTNQIEDKKFGVFQKDLEAFVSVTNALGLIKKDTPDWSFYRHPLVYLVEAADDICYTIIDFEDGINKGLISEDYALEYLIQLVKDRIDNEKYRMLPSKEDRMSYLRALAIGALIADAVHIFNENEKAILEGNFPVSLMAKSKYLAQMEDIIQISVPKIYQSDEVIQKELKGYQIIQHLLQYGVFASERNFEGKTTNFDRLFLKQIPEKYWKNINEPYHRLLGMAQFVSMLTDGKAVELYQLVKE
ncbi:MAG: dNTP triphosphohydrolase [Flavobacteriales bacterium]|nr:dNTP triphosphohydrolase [Flavobacteriales bacterium]